MSFAGDGGAIASWMAARPQIAVRRPGAERFRALVALPAADALLAPVPYGRSRFAVGFERGGRLSAAFGDARTGQIGRRTTVRTTRTMLRPSLAGNRRGDLALVWFENRGVRTDRVYVSLRRRGGRFGRPLLVATDRVRQTAVAVSEGGAVLVAWETAGRMRVRLRLGGRDRFGRAQTLSSRPTYGAIPRAAFAPNGSAYVAWAGQSPSELGASGPVEVAVKRFAGEPFHRAQTLDPTGRRSGPVSLVVAEGDRALLAWDDDGSVAVAMTPFGSTRFAAPQVVGRGVRPAAAMSLTAVEAVVAWQAGDDEGSGGVLASYRPSADGPFGAPEAVSDAGPARIPAVAFAPAGPGLGLPRPLLVLSNRPSGAPPAAAYAYERAG